MNIQKNAFVSLSYVLRTGGADGPIIEQTPESQPLNFVFGAGRMLPYFEAGIEGLQPGASFAFGITADNAYGPQRPEAIVDVPKNIFVMDGKLREDLLQLGTRVPMVGEGGRRIVGIVLEVSDSQVKLDFNHPLAGEDLFFSGEIIEVRDATVEELLDSQPHGCSGGCGGGCHGGGCGGGCSDDDS